MNSAEGAESDGQREDHAGSAGVVAAAAATQQAGIEPQQARQRWHNEAFEGADKERE